MRRSSLCVGSIAGALCWLRAAPAIGQPDVIEAVKVIETGESKLYEVAVGDRRCGRVRISVEPVDPSQDNHMECYVDVQPGPGRSPTRVRPYGDEDGPRCEMSYDGEPGESAIISHITLSVHNLRHYIEGDNLIREEDDEKKISMKIRFSLCADPAPVPPTAEELARMQEQERLRVAARARATQVAAVEQQERDARAKALEETRALRRRRAFVNIAAARRKRDCAIGRISACSPAVPASATSP